VGFEEKAIKAICEVYRKYIPDNNIKFFSSEKLEEDLRNALENVGAEDVMMYWTEAFELHVGFSHGKDDYWAFIDIDSDRIQIYKKIVETVVKR